MESAKRVRWGVGILVLSFVVQGIALAYIMYFSTGVLDYPLYPKHDRYEYLRRTARTIGIWSWAPFAAAILGHLGAAMLGSAYGRTRISSQQEHESSPGDREAETGPAPTSREEPYSFFRFQAVPRNGEQWRGAAVFAIGLSLIAVVATGTLIFRMVASNTYGGRGMNFLDGLSYMFSGVLFPSLLATASFLFVTLLCAAVWSGLSGSRKLVWLALGFLLAGLIVFWIGYSTPASAREKPVIYLYAEREQPVSVRLKCPEIVSCSYPRHGTEGWRVLARPDGSLTDLATGREHYCLYWEGLDDLPSDFGTGFVVPGGETAGFLEDALGKLGLNEREANEFIIYWLPRMAKNRFNAIHFETEGYERRVPLLVEPRPDTVIRVFMLFRSCDVPHELPTQQLEAKERRGFTLVEWGGAELSR